MHLYPIHFPIPLYLPSNLATFSPNKIKFKRKRKKKKKSILLWKLQCDTVSHAVDPLIYKSLLANVHCRVIGLVQALWFLLYYWCRALTGIFLGYPVVVLYHGDRSFGSARLVYSYAPGEPGFVSPPALTCPLNIGELFFIALFSSLLASMSKGRGPVLLSSLMEKVSNFYLLEHIQFFPVVRTPPMS